MSTKMTKEQLHGMVADIVGPMFAKLEERIADGKSDAAKMLADLALGSAPRLVVSADDERRKSLNAVVFMQSMALAAKPGEKRSAEKIAKEMEFENVAKVLGTTDATAGGLLVDPEFSTEFINFLRAKTVILESGARTIDMPSGQLMLKRADTGATAAYRGESANATVSELSTGEVALNAKILDVLTPISNQLLSRGSLNNLELVRDDLVAAARDRMDSVMIRGVGSAFAPKGLLFQAATANKVDETNAVGTFNASTTAEIVGDLGEMIRKLMDSNLGMTHLGWLFSNQIWKRFFTELDANSRPVFRDELMQGTIFKIPFLATTNIPANLTASAGSGSGAQASELYLADFFEVLVGQTEGMKVSVSTEAAYDPGGGLVSAFQRGETVIKVELEHDMIERRNGVAIAVLESVTWGATA